MSLKSSASLVSNPPREEAMAQTLASLHRHWRLATCLPAVYLLGAVLLQRFYFLPELGGRGLMPIPQDVEVAALFVGAVVVVLLHRLLVTLRDMHLAKLAAVAHDAKEFRARARSQQYLQFSICDFACAPGVTLFLLQGTILPMAVFLMASLFFYLTILPSGRKLGEAMFRPEKFPTLETD